MHENFGICQEFLVEDFGIFQCITIEDFGILFADVGYVYENVVSQMLVAGRHKLYYHTWPTPSGKHNYEIDFLLSRQAKVCPIEVKSSTSNVHTSIDEFQKKFSSRIYQRYLLHAKDIRKEQDLLSLPIYMALFL